MSKVVFVKLDSSLSALLRSSGAIPLQEGVEMSEGVDFSAEGLDGSGGHDIDAVVLGADLEDPIRMSQRIHRVSETIPVIILATRERCLQINRALRFMPFIGDDVSCQLVDRPNEVAGRLKHAIEKSRKRRQLRATVDVMRSRQARAERLSPQHRGDAGLLERLLDFAPVGVIGVDQDGSIMTWNPRAVEILDIQTDAMLGAPIQDLLPFRERTGREAMLQRIRDPQEGETGGEVLERRLAPGRRQWMEVMVAPLSGRSGEQGALILLQDITARKTAEVQLKASLAREKQARKKAEEAKQRLSFMSEATKAFMTELDYLERLEMFSRFLVPQVGDWCAVDLIEQDGRLERKVNTTVGGLPEPVSRAGDGEVVARLDDPAHPLVAALESGSPRLVRAGEVGALACFRAAGCPRAVSLLIVPLKVRGEGIGTVTLATLAGGKKLSEEDLELTQELANRAALALDNARLLEQALDAVKVREDFISIASHELKTPITALQLQNQISERLINQGRKEAFDPERITRMVESSARQLKNLSHLVEDMLDVSRLAAGRLMLSLEPVDLVALVREVCERVEAQCRAAGCEPELRLPAAPVMVQADAGRIAQVVQNLLNNAIKYAAQSPITVSVTGGESQAEIRVADRGPGIPDKDRERIFQQFERAVDMSNISGFGLGLFIARGIVEEHGGCIRVASQPGQGSAFTVELPVRKAAGA